MPDPASRTEAGPRELATTVETPRALTLVYELSRTQKAWLGHVPELEDVVAAAPTLLRVRDALCAGVRARGIVPELVDITERVSTRPTGIWLT